MRQKKIFFAVLLTILAMPICAQNSLFDFSAVAPSGQTLYYTITGNGATITIPYCNNYGYYYYDTFPSGDLVIPDSVTYNHNTYPVINIGYKAFHGCLDLTSVVIPDEVISIGEMAFTNCGRLISLTLGSGIASIDSSAFMDCSGLTYIVVDTGNMHFDSRNNCNAIIQTDMNLLLRGCNATVIPNTITAIGDYAFWGCRNMTSIIIPENVTSIGKEAFFACELTNISFPNSLIWIGDNAFAECWNLTDINLPNSITHIGSGAFGGCSRLTSITIPSSVTTINERTFSGCWGVNDIQVPNSVTSIGNDAFSMVNNVIYHGSATGSPWGAKTVNGYWEGDLVYTDSTRHYLTGCKLAAENVVIPNNTYRIGQYAIINSSSIISITLGDSVNHLDNEAISCLWSLQSITSRNLQVPTITYNIAHNLPSSVSINVPDCKLSTYRSSNRWRNFSNFYGFSLYTTRVYSENTDKGSVIISTPYSCDYGYMVISAVPNDGYELTQWSDGITDNPRTVYVTQDTTLIAEFEVQTHNIQLIYSQGSTVSVIEGSTTVPHGGSVTLEVATDECHYFQRWDDYSINPIRRVENIISDTTIIAYSLPYVYNVTIDNYTGGSISSNYGNQVNCGTTVTLTATPDNGYSFVRWSDNITDNPRQITVTSDTAMTAIFEAIQYTVTVNANNSSMGTVSGGGTYNYGSNVDLAATANIGYHFVRWSDNNTDNPRQITVTGNVTLTAIFEAVQYTVTATANNASMGTVTGSGTYNYGTTVTLTATANNGYTFVQWSDNNTDNPRNFAVTGNITLTAMFAPIGSLTEEVNIRTCTGQTLRMEINNATHTATVIGYVGQCEGGLVVPAWFSIDDVRYTVTAIGPRAFENCIGLESVTLPVSITLVDEEAFKGCSGLLKMDIK